MKKTQKFVSMGEGAVGTALLRLALPAVATMLLHNLFHLVDTVFVSRLGGTALAAMSLTFPVIFVMFALLNGMALGCTALISRFLGENTFSEAQDTARSGSILLLLLCFLPLPLLYRPWGENFFAFIGGAPSVIPLCLDYMLWLLPSLPFMAITLLGDSAFRCQGNTVIPLYSMVMGNGVNLILDPLFIFTLNMGITGAALATFTGRLCSALFVLYKLKQESPLKILPSRGLPNRLLSRWHSIIRIGFPASLSQASIALGIILMNRVLSNYGPNALAAWLLGNRVEGLAFLPVMGIRNALTPFLGYNLGLCREDRLREALRWSVQASLLIMISVGIFLYAFPGVILAIFAPSPEVEQMAIASIRASVFGYPLAATEITLMALFEGTGKTLYSMVIQMLRALLFRPPLGWFLATFFGLGAFWWCQPLSSLGSCTISLFLAFALLRSLSSQKQDTI
ncbi:MAG TPA: MATE family efflux transporter [Synergistaceae bacterium]|nr:MATE family efflux transporter [Synergistaceae bacterium]HPQ36318.1 MATE family efflux transporter [Synergistaceae bacterium]